MTVGQRNVRTRAWGRRVSIQRGEILRRLVGKGRHRRRANSIASETRTTGDRPLLITLRSPFDLAIANIKTDIHAQHCGDTRKTNTFAGGGIL